MISKNTSSELTYSKIKKEVGDFCKVYKKDNVLPALLTDEQLKPYQEIINDNYRLLVDGIKKHFDKVGADVNNALDHVLWVAVRAGYIAEKECKLHDFDLNKTQSLVKKTILAGLLHDIERHLGLKEHMETGFETAGKMLAEYNLLDRDIVEAIRYHDIIDYIPDGSEEYKILFGSLFDADHLRWGVERENDFWDMKKRRGVIAKDVIHDYQWLYPLRNAWKTEYGKNVCKAYIEFAIAIAEHIGEVFSQ